MCCGGIELIGCVVTCGESLNHVTIVGEGRVPPTPSESSEDGEKGEMVQGGERW